MVKNGNLFKEWGFYSVWWQACMKLEMIIWVLTQIINDMLIEAKGWRLNDQSTILTIFMEQELIKDK